MFPVKGWIIDHDPHDLFDGPIGIVHFLDHYGETVQTDVMPRGVTMVIDGEGALKCSISLSSKMLADSTIYSSLQSTWSHLYL